MVNLVSIESIRNVIYSTTSPVHENVLLFSEYALKCHPSKKLARHEYEIGCKAFEGGAPVPKMHDIISPDQFFLRSFISKPLRKWYTLMQGIDGEHLSLLDETELSEAFKQYDDGLEKLFSLGICPIDSESLYHNLLYDQTQKKLFFIDFEHWFLTNDTAKMRLLRRNAMKAKKRFRSGVEYICK